MKRLLLTGLVCVICAAGAACGAARQDALVAGRNYIQNGLVQVKAGMGNAHNEVHVLIFDPQFEEYTRAWRLCDHGSGKVYEKLSADRIEGITTSKKDGAVSMEWALVHKTDSGETVVKSRATLKTGKYSVLFEPVERAQGIDSLFYMYPSMSEWLCIDGKSVSTSNRTNPDGTDNVVQKFNRSLAFYHRLNSFANIFVWMGEKDGYTISFYQPKGMKYPHSFYSNPSFPSNQAFCTISLPVDASITGNEEKAKEFFQKAIKDNMP